MHTVTLAGPADFDGWRDAARALALAGVSADRVLWRVAGDGGKDLFGAGDDPCMEFPPALPDRRLTVPKAFLDLALGVVMHRDKDRFALLYALLLRLQDERILMEDAADPAIRKLETMAKAVRRDIHKMRAFLRFRKVAGAGECYVAWFEPDHHIVEHNGDFFARRFAGMRWTILTPDRSAMWDRERLSFGPGASKSDSPGEDATEDLWTAYFASIFNPARLKVKAMTAEMPKKYWKNLPEARLIPSLIAGAEGAARDMLARNPTLPPAFHETVQARYWSGKEPAMPDGTMTIKGLAAEARGCTRCPLYENATQTVFGEGPADAAMMLVGEQPGDQEDLAGRPFVGPAGKLLAATLDDLGIDRTALYVTNAVKHFKFEPRGKRRIHQKPNAGEVLACRWWLDREIGLVRPKLVVALGATAAQSLLGRAVSITRERGQVVRREEDGLAVFLTVHPSYLLRIPDQVGAAAERRRFAEDLKAADDWLRQAAA